MAGLKVQSLDSGTKGRTKAAIIAISLGTEATANVFRFMREEEVEQLIVEISKIGSIDPHVSEQVLEEFYKMCLAQKYITEGGLDFAKEALEKAFGAQTAAGILRKIQNSLKVRAFDFIQGVEPQHLLECLQNEHAQTIALILSYARTDQASQIIAMLPPETQLEVVERMATLGRTSPETLRNVEASLEKRLSSALSSRAETDGVKKVAEVLNNIDRSAEKYISEELFKRNQELAEEIRKRMFVFEDIVLLDSVSIQRVLAEVDMHDLMIALKGSDSETQEVIYANISARLKATIKEDMQYMRNVRMRDVDEAQQRIVDMVRKLESAGEITIQRGGGNNVFL